MLNDKHKIAFGYHVVIASMDFETYSEAGYQFDEKEQKFTSLDNSRWSGLKAIGTPAYSEHKSTEILSLAYNLKDGEGVKLWTPKSNPPIELFKYIENGGLIEAWNSAFEYYIWLNVCQKRMGWPGLPLNQTRDAMAKAHAFSLPGALDKVGKILKSDIQKDSDGDRLLKKFSMPIAPKKNNNNKLREYLTDDKNSEDAKKLYTYNITDINTEDSISMMIPDLTKSELELWLVDQKINFRGVQIDVKSVKHCMNVINEAKYKYTTQLIEITNGEVPTVGSTDKFKDWIQKQGVEIESMQAKVVEKTLERSDLPENVIKVLKIRQYLASSAALKVFSIYMYLSKDDRLRNLYVYHGAGRTGRFTGRGPNPLNLAKSGPNVVVCDESKGCGKHYSSENSECPWCGKSVSNNVTWNAKSADDVLEIIKTEHLETIEHYFGDVFTAVAGCLRGLFIAKKGYDLISSDYSSIEAVILAFLSGEQWRMKVFNSHGKIYEMSGAKITKVPFDEIISYKSETGKHHYARALGKVGELAAGFGGGINSWKKSGAAKYFDSDDDLLRAVKQWRLESPMIPKLWTGLESNAIKAVQFPGDTFSYRGIKYCTKEDVLYCRLLSGRKIAYQSPVLHDYYKPWGDKSVRLTYMGWNSGSNQGKKGWVRLTTWGGKLVENVCQSIARDILAETLKRLEQRDYPTVMHVYDEIICEVLKGFGSIQELEEIMEIMPDWCKDWPIKACDGWRGDRYRKD